MRICCTSRMHINTLARFCSIAVGGWSARRTKHPFTCTALPTAGEYSMYTRPWCASSYTYRLDMRRSVCVSFFVLNRAESSWMAVQLRSLLGVVHRAPRKTVSMQCVACLLVCAHMRPNTYILVCTRASQYALAHPCLYPLLHDTTNLHLLV